MKIPEANDVDRKSGDGAHGADVDRRFRISPKEIQAASRTGGNPCGTFVTIQRIDDGEAL
jgi:hypothetical protein